MNLQKATRPPSDRTMAVATVAEVARELGPPIAPYVDVRAVIRHYPLVKDFI